MTESTKMNGRSALLKQRGVNVTTVSRKKPIEIKESSKVKSVNLKEGAPEKSGKLESESTKSILRDSIRKSKQLNKQIKKEQSNEQTKEKQLTFKDVIQKRIIGQNGNKDDPNKLSIVKNIKSIDVDILSDIINNAEYCIKYTTSFTTIPIPDDKEELTPEMLDNILLDCDNIYDLMKFFQEFCRVIIQINKENNPEKIEEKEKKAEQNEKDNEKLNTKKATLTEPNGMRNKVLMTIEKHNEKLNTKEATLTEPNGMRNKVLMTIEKHNEKLNTKEATLTRSSNIRSKTLMTIEKSKFKKLFENNSNNITIERKNGFLDKDNVYRQSGGFHYEIKNGNTTYIVDVNERELLKIKPTNGGTIEFKDLEKCLTLSVAGPQIELGGIKNYKTRKPITTFNKDNTNTFASAFNNKNIDVEMKKEAFLEAFGEYAFNQQKEKETNQKFKDYRRQKTISDKKNENGQKINYLYHVLKTKQRSIER